jgi:3D-(3,5/4)-trihydroxycyclohexane-1,2-dione acylhydrolase (decyclizing)
VERTVVIDVEVDRYVSVPSYDAWWEVPVAATADAAGVREARKGFEKAKQKQRRYL